MEEREQALATETKSMAISNHFSQTTSFNNAKVKCYDCHRKGHYAIVVHQKSQIKPLSPPRRPLCDELTQSKVQAGDNATSSSRITTTLLPLQQNFSPVTREALRDPRGASVNFRLCIFCLISSLVSKKEGSPMIWTIYDFKPKNSKQWGKVTEKQITTMRIKSDATLSSSSTRSFISSEVTDFSIPSVNDDPAEGILDDATHEHLVQYRILYSTYEKLGKKFDFLTKLNRLEPLNILDRARNLEAFYPGGLEGTLQKECLPLRDHLSLAETTEGT
ncbi:unnamed protein product [Timema podura]|uniref:Uncharacterized protein n=1 Tax=Timema podura TaxID=61482 RepID=A0ABN7NCZ7_TIMPD|nr:unnamed protein product [Timema podura]